MRELGIIVVVAIVGLTGSALMAIALYLIDKNADRHDKQS